MTKACLWTADEWLDIYFRYGITPDQDLWRVGFNLIYRFGNIFDRVYEFADIFAYTLIAGQYAPLEWYYMGGLFGRILVEVLYPDRYPDIQIVYPLD